MDDNGSKFNKFEKLFFRIELTIFGMSVLLYFIFLWFIEFLGPFVDFIMTVMLLSIVIIIVVFGLSIIRIIKYIIKHRSDKHVSIWRSILNLFLSPLSLIILYILIFITVAASCTYGG